MKKLIVGIVAIACGLIIAPVMAATPKVPSNLCLDWTSFSDTDLLGVKAGPTIKTADGPLKQYVIQGNHAAGSAYSFPVHGSGYVLPTGIFHATYTGSQVVGTGGTKDVWFFELFYDIVAETGTLHYHITRSNNTGFGNQSGADRFSCLSAPTAPAMTSGGEKTARDP